MDWGHRTAVISLPPRQNAPEAADEATLSHPSRHIKLCGRRARPTSSTARGKDASVRERKVAREVSRSVVHEVGSEDVEKLASVRCLPLNHPPAVSTASPSVRHFDDDATATHAEASGLSDAVAVWTTSLAGSDRKSVAERSGATRPAEQTARAHVAALVEAAGHSAVRESPPPAGREPPSKRRLAWPKRRLALLSAAVVIGILLLLAGLAAAGVKLPGVARTPFDGFGIQLPNQTRADSVKSAIHSTAPDERDCSFGRQIAGAANAGRGGPPEAPCSKQGAHGTGRGPDGDRHAGRSFGQQMSASARHSASHQARASGEQTSQPRQGIGQQASSSPPPEPETSTSSPQQPQAPSGPPQSETGRGIAEQRSSAGQQIGAQHSQTGQSIGQGQSQAGNANPSQASGGHGP